MTGALNGFRVLDLTHVLAGPFCTYQFALLGADVIKVEDPANPDCARGRGPDDGMNARQLGLTYQVQAGNKRSLALDLGSEPGRNILLDLAREADVLVENYTTGALARLGLGYDDVAAVNPAIVYCSMTGFGDSGPASETGAYDNVIQAASGIVGQCNGVKPGVSFVDYAAGYSAAFAISAALLQRERTGRGAHISASMLEVAMTLMAPEAAAAQFATGPRRNREAGIQSYDTADGALMLAAFTPAQYRKLGHCLVAEGWTVRELDECRDWPDVWRLSPVLQPQLAEIFLTRAAGDWVALLHAVDLPAERVVSLAEAVASPQLAARNLYRPSPRGDGATLPTAPFTMSEGGPSLKAAPPGVGEHSDDILRSAGRSNEQIEALRAEGIVR